MLKSTLTKLTLLLFTIITASFAQADTPWPVGEWHGTIDLGQQQLDIVYHLSASDDEMTGSMDVPAQGAMGLPLRAVRVDGDQIVIEMPMGDDVRFEGIRNNGSIDGTFSQAGQSFRLSLSPTGNVPAPSRPQEPAEPLPYLATPVSFDGAGVRLTGTLTRPESSSPIAGVVLVAGAGPHDRDGTFMDHRPLLVLADRLTRAGFAVLRFDERGVGDSKGEFITATPEQLSADIAAAAEYLRDQRTGNLEQVGILAHSEGGRISALAVKAHAAADFLVLLGTPAIPGIVELRKQAQASQNPVAQLQLAMAEAALQSGDGENAQRAMREAAEALVRLLKS